MMGLLVRALPAVEGGATVPLVDRGAPGFPVAAGLPARAAAGADARAGEAAALGPRRSA